MIGAHQTTGSSANSGSADTPVFASGAAKKPAAAKTTTAKTTAKAAPAKKPAAKKPRAKKTDKEGE